MKAMMVYFVKLFIKVLMKMNLKRLGKNLLLNVTIWVDLIVWEKYEILKLILKMECGQHEKDRCFRKK